MAAGDGAQLPATVAASRSVEKALEEAAASGALNLSNRKLKEFPRTARNYDLSDITHAGELSAAPRGSRGSWPRDRGAPFVLPTPARVCANGADILPVVAQTPSEAPRPGALRCHRCLNCTLGPFVMKYIPESPRKRISALSETFEASTLIITAPFCLLLCPRPHRGGTVVFP